MVPVLASLGPPVVLKASGWSRVWEFQAFSDLKIFRAENKNRVGVIWWETGRG
jgi:hypothetical protein